MRVFRLKAMSTVAVRCREMRTTFDVGVRNFQFLYMKKAARKGRFSSTEKIILRF